MTQRMSFTRVLADKYKSGYNRLSLRDDAARSYCQVYDIMHSCGGIMTSSGGLRSLKTKPKRSRSSTSFHYLGLAFDLYIYSAMVDINNDPYVISRCDERDYIVFARCHPEYAEIERIDDVISYKKRICGNNVSGSFINLTELLKRYGFEKIKARKNFEQGGSILGAEWWHFQYERNLVCRVSTFGEELLKVYSEEKLVNTIPWKYRDRVYGKDWF